MRRGHKYSLSHIYLFCSYVSFKAAKKHKQRWRIHNVVIFSIAMQCTQILINQFLWENFHTYTASDRIHSYTERRNYTWPMKGKSCQNITHEILTRLYVIFASYLLRIVLVFQLYCRYVARSLVSTYSYIPRGLRLSKGGVALP